MTAVDNNNKVDAGKRVIFEVYIKIVVYIIRWKKKEIRLLLHLFVLYGVLLSNSNKMIVSDATME